MGSKELIEYIEDNQMELQQIYVLLFNSENFHFMPLNNPTIDSTGNNFSIIAGDDINVLNTGYQTHSFFYLDESKSKELNKFP